MKTHKASMLAALLLTVLVSPATAIGSEGADFDIPEARPWQEVEQLTTLAGKAAAVSGVGRYDAMGGSLVFAPDGRLAMVMAGDEEGAPPRAAMLGTHARTGNWLELRFDGFATNVDALSDEERAEYEAWEEEADAEAAEDAEAIAEAADEGDTADGEALAAPADESSDASTEDDGSDPRLQRLLIVPYRGGELLVDASSLRGLAARWDGKGPLEIHARAWRLPATETVHEYRGYKIDDPLSAPLPHELRSLLRPESIEVTMVGLVDAERDLAWNGPYGQVELRIDRGSDHGLYPEMSLYGLPPDEAVYARVTKVEADHAFATYSLERFSPDEKVVLPAPGMRLATQRASRGTTGCGIDTSVALRGKVVRASSDATSASYDKFGYAFLTLTLDQGSADGVMVGDSFDAEAEGIDGVGRVRAVTAKEATVLWRVQRYAEEHVVTSPVAGDALVTPAWQRAANDTFGSPAAEEVILD